MSASLLPIQHLAPWFACLLPTSPINMFAYRSAAYNTAALMQLHLLLRLMQAILLTSFKSVRVYRQKIKHRKLEHQHSCVHTHARARTHTHTHTFTPFRDFRQQPPPQIPAEPLLSPPRIPSAAAAAAAAAAASASAAAAAVGGATNISPTGKGRDVRESSSSLGGGAAAMHGAAEPRSGTMMNHGGAVGMMNHGGAVGMQVCVHRPLNC